MSLTYIVVTLQADQVAEKALQTSPYNTVAYGVLVALLITALTLLWREYKSTLERHREYVEKTTGLIQLVESKLDAVEDLEDTNKELKGEISKLKERIGQLSEYINLLRGDGKSS